jgi:hypothetical protein
MARYQPQQSSYIESADISTKLIVKTDAAFAQGGDITYDFTSGADRIGDRGAQFMTLNCTDGSVNLTITNNAGVSDVVPLVSGGTWTSLTLEDFEIFSIRIQESSGTASAAYQMMVY